MSKEQKFIATISKEFTFDAAHHIPSMPDGHKCRSLHGHTYRVEILLRDYVGESGFFIDYGDIAALWNAYVNIHLDHKLLNDLIPIPTTENLASWIVRELVDHLPSLDRVRVHESSSTYCEVSVMELRAAGVLPIPLAPRTLTPRGVVIPEKK